MSSRDKTHEERGQELLLVLWYYGEGGKSWRDVIRAFGVVDETIREQLFLFGFDRGPGLIGRPRTSSGEVWAGKWKTKVSTKLLSDIKEVQDEIGRVYGDTVNTRKIAGDIQVSYEVVSENVLLSSESPVEVSCGTELQTFPVEVRDTEEDRRMGKSEWNLHAEIRHDYMVLLNCLRSMIFSTFGRCKEIDSLDLPVEHRLELKEMEYANAMRTETEIQEMIEREYKPTDIISDLMDAPNRWKALENQELNDG